VLDPALPNKAATTIAAVLFILFLQQGAQLILHSDNGKEFVAKIIGELMKLWLDCKIVNGSPRHPQSQGSVEWEMQIWRKY
jgi:transposase InsO family protein